MVELLVELAEVVEEVVLCNKVEGETEASVEAEVAAEDDRDGGEGAASVGRTSGANRG